MSEYIDICPNCLEHCNIVTIDMGIGHYEYWGSCGKHSKLQDVTDCCEAEPKEGGQYESAGVDACHLNGGDVVCGKCPAVKLCMDALPFEEDV